MSTMHPKDIWLQAAEKVKDRVINPTLYRALELGVGIMADEDYFVLGFANADLPMASHLRSSQHATLIEQCLSEVMGRKVRLRVIEGTTLADYEAFKKHTAAREASVTSLTERREQERQVQLAWEEVGEKITRAYARMHLRQLPQTRAELMKNAFRVIDEACRELGYDENAEELHVRSLARVFEKLAVVVEVPSAQLAYEFYKLREEGKLG